MEELKQHGRTQESIQKWLVDMIAETLEIDADEVDVHETFENLGLDSADSVILSGDLSNWLGFRLAPTIVWDFPCIADLAAHLAASTAAVEQKQAATDEQPQSAVEHGEPLAEQTPANEPIAIVGIGCRFPGAAGPQAFWNLLRSGVDAISEADRWNAESLYDPDASVPGKLTTKWGGFLEQIDQFDPQFFGISPLEAARMDPQQRLLIEVAWEALQDAGIQTQQLSGSKTGVYIGISTNDYSKLQFSDPAFIDAYAGTSNAFSIAANRLSYLLDLRGPSLAVDTACSSSLVSVHLACQSLQSGESELAIAGGVNLILSPDIGINFSKAGAMAADGRCKTFDSRADGYVRSEGAGLVVLKPLSRALADGDAIYALIRGGAVNQDGKSNGLMAPNRLAQEDVLRQAYQDAGILPQQVQYVEAHGTGTALGDPIEVSALQNVVAADRSLDHPCHLGSVKTNLGHLESAAGIAGLIKVALALKHQELPPSLHFQSLNPHISLEGVALQIQTELTPWPKNGAEPAIAGVSAFGFGGTNAHLVLSEAPATKPQPERPARTEVLALSAHTPQALRQRIESMQAYVNAADTAASFYDLCYNANTLRDHYKHRVAIVADNKTELAERLTALLRDEPHKGLVTAPTSQRTPKKLAFVLPGQGPQWWGMGRELLAEEPVFKNMIEKCDQIFTRLAGWSLLDVFNMEPSDSPIHQTEYTQPCLFAVQVALAELWKSWGVQPDAIVGHSMGEVAAAYLAGALSLEEAICAIYYRGFVMRNATGHGKMATVSLSQTEAQQALQGFEDKVSIAAVNSPTSVVLSGDPDSLETIVARLQASDVFCKFLRVDLASHSPQMEPLRGELEAALQSLQPQPPAIPIYSTVTAQQMTEQAFDAAYWGANLRNTVRFAETLQQMIADGYDAFVEISPHPILTGVVEEALLPLGASEQVWPSLRREEPERERMLLSLAALYTAGMFEDWRPLYPNGARVALPLYPWQKTRHWFEEGQRLLALKANAGVDAWETVTKAAKFQAQQAPFDLELSRYPQQSDLLERLTNAYLLECLHQLGVFQQAGERQTIDSILTQNGLLPSFQKLIYRWLKRCVDKGWLMQAGDEFSCAKPLPRFSLPELWQEAEQFPAIDVLLQYMKRSGENLASVLKGATNPLELFFPDGSFDTTEGIYQHSAIARYYNSIARSVAEACLRSLRADRPVRILEIGAGTGATSASLLPVLPKHRTRYVFTDLSDFFLERARNKFRDYPFVQYQILNIENNPLEQGFQAHSFDLIVAANVLHATRDLHETLENVRTLLAPGGQLMLWEVTHHQTWFDITFGLIDGWQRHEDELRGDNPLLSAADWQSVLQEHGFDRVLALPETGSPAEALEQHILLGSPLEEASDSDWSGVAWQEDNYATEGARESVQTAEAAQTDLSLRDRLQTLEPKQWSSEVQTVLHGQIAKTLGTSPAQVDTQQSINTLGLDSLMAVKLRNWIVQNLGVTVPVSVFMEGVSTAELSALITEQLQTFAEVAATATVDSIIPDQDNRHLPFPLNDIQQAYWIGRSSGLELGNIATQLYLEFESSDLDIKRLNLAWQKVIERHDMMRAIFLPTGEQQILAAVPFYEIALDDLRGLPSEQAEAHLATVREHMAQEIRQPDQWPLFQIRAHRLSDQTLRLHIAFDFLIADAASLLILFTEWSRLYQNPAVELPPLTLSFRDYVLAEHELRSADAYQQSLNYWKQRVQTLPPAPELPLVQAPSSLQEHHFTRQTAEISAPVWSRLKERAAKAGLTPSMLLCAAYADILRTGSKNQRFTLNLTLFNRMPLHEQVNQLVGDFTTLNLLEVDASVEESFVERALRIQRQLLEDLEHSRVSGIQVLRELTKAQRTGAAAAMPIVFTSVMEDFSEQMEWLGEMVSSLSQTPQVWLDHQVLEKAGALFLIWDGVEELFPSGMLQDMFQAYSDFLLCLAEEESAWEEVSHPHLPPKQIAQANALNETYAPLAEGLLHDGFAKQSRLQPDQPAVIAADKSLTYGELDRLSNQLGRLLRTHGTRPNQLVAIVMEKGWEQVLAVLGIERAGGAYLPIDPEVPTERLHYLLDNTDAKIVLTQSWIDQKTEWPSQVERFCLDQLDLSAYAADALEPLQTPNDLAYVIFTSGSTGQPKGVMIDHRGALNTIVDINQRFAIGPNDRVLALAALNFDLSVYDLFGVLHAGGTIVMPEPTAIRDPLRWIELIEQHRVTLFNSVPALMQLLVDTLEGAPRQLSHFPRLVMMSGDWIPLSLPAKIKAIQPETQVISLGGATEASIWSILYPIEEVQPEWKSIPYGRPMVNQQFYVLNERLELCPQHVVGQLYIGGVGLAKGYWRDEKKTNAHFLVHPTTGERLYKTGDLGRYAGDVIEFLGREDFQVKIHGYRIELGEIENALQQHAEVSQAVVTAVGVQAEKRLVAYFVAEGDAMPDSSDLRQFLLQKLPEYMVPTVYVPLAQVPFNANGKVDLKALPAPDLAKHQIERAYAAPRTAQEAAVAEIWGKVIGVEQVGIHDDFFDLGGNSLHAIQAVVQMTKAGLSLTAQKIFEHPTIAELLASLETVKNETIENESDKHAAVNEQSVQNQAASGDADQQALPESAVVQADWQLAFDASASAQPEHVFITGATGYLGSYLLREVLTQTNARVYCLVRANDEAAGQRRLQQALENYFPAAQVSQWLARIQPVLGDIGQPKLGIASDQYEFLCQTIDLIYHSAAEVRHLGEIEHFHRLNVQGTESVIALAQTGKGKLLHHLSTVGVRGINPEITSFSEQDFDLGQEFDTPYAQSKWQAEKAVRTAIANGCRAVIHRIGFVAADSQTGKFQQNIGDNALYSYIRSTLHTGVAPYLPDLLLDFTPVDFVAQAIVKLSLTPGTAGQTFHLVNPQPLRHYDLMRIFQALGYSLMLLDFDTYIQTVFTLNEAADYQAELSGIVGFLNVNRARILDVKCEATQQALQQLGVSCPPCTPEWIRLMVQHCIEAGYLQAPAYWGRSQSVPALLS